MSMACRVCRPTEPVSPASVALVMSEAVPDKPLTSERTCESYSQMNDVSAAQLFVRVVEMGSFSAAARELGMTPSNVSRQIANLEIELGARLLHRTTRKLSLSEAGELYLQSAKTIVAEIDRARDAVGRFSEAPAGDLHVTMEADMAIALIAPILPKFMDKYPQVRVRITMSSHLLDLVENGIDLAVRMAHMESSSLVARRILVSRSLLLASPLYLSQYGMPAEPGDLERHKCLSFRVESKKQIWRFELEDGVYGAPIRPIVNANSVTLLKELALAGCGIAMMPFWMVQEELRLGQLQPVLSEYRLTPSETPISAVYPDGRHLAPKVRAFIDFLAIHLSKNNAADLSKP